MDYDGTEIASVYDKARTLAPETLRFWLDLVARDAAPAPGSLIIDLGCGTGRFSEPLAEHFESRVIGVDPSSKMLEQARGKLRGDRVVFECASASALPVADGAADLVFISMALHHFDDVAAAARECRRVLRKGRHVVLRNSTGDTDFPKYRFFPAIAPIVAAELPPRCRIAELFLNAGFTLGVHEIVPQVVAENWKTYAQKTSVRADSFLSRISDTDFATGMVALRVHAAEAPPGEVVTEDVDWFVFVA
jgi:ubiquinone/menaquinone biosynthesis C-methylase UbiE